ncbi:MAG: pyrroline-5-carboxylate reductase [Kangiella sp.]|nr:MAG: pyrroline-5-carboxylate reductase [Kangiella sp.]
MIDSLTLGEIKIGFIGCGNMSSAIIKGMVQAKYDPKNISVSNRSVEKLHSIQKELNIGITQNNSEICENALVIVIAVKPQMFATVCEPLRNIDFSDKLIISIAAGVKTSQISAFLQHESAVIRAMPNTPSVISEGATGLFANTKCNQQQKDIAEKIFQSVGKTAWVKDEDQINTVTAIAGSAPAYIYLFMQAMVDQAVSLGFNAKDARTLITQSFIGTAKLAQFKSDIQLDDLRQAVTSPGGTTFEAIQSFKNNNFSEIVKEAVNAAYNRGVSLGEAGEEGKPL